MMQQQRQENDRIWPQGKLCLHFSKETTQTQMFMEISTSSYMQL